MPLVAENVVAPAAILPANAQLPAGLLQQPPLFGVVDAVAGTVTVLWNTGLLQATIAANSLRLVQAPDAVDVNTFRGKFVRLNANNASPEFQGTVVALFKLEINDTGGTVAATSVALVRTNTGLYWLAQTSEIALVSGR